MKETGKARLIRSVRVLARIIRLRNALITFFGVLVGATLVDTVEVIPMNSDVMMAGLAAFLIVGGGNTLNDFFDYEIDKTNRPDRPIPSGMISRSDSLMLSATLFLVGLGLAKSINRYALIIAITNTLILILYAKFSKRLLLISNLSISYLVASIFLFGAVSVSSDINGNTGSIHLATVLFACAFLMTFTREIVKDIEDFEGDRRAYSRTLPIVLGISNAKRIAIVFGLTAVVLSLVPLVHSYQTINESIYGIIIGLADVIFVAALTMYAPLSQKVMVLGMLLSLFGFFFGNIATKI